MKGMCVGEDETQKKEKRRGVHVSLIFSKVHNSGRNCQDPAFQKPSKEWQQVTAAWAPWRVTSAQVDLLILTVRSGREVKYDTYWQKIDIKTIKTLCLLSLHQSTGEIQAQGD